MQDAEERTVDRGEGSREARMLERLEKQESQSPDQARLGTSKAR